MQFNGVADRGARDIAQVFHVVAGRHRLAAVFDRDFFHRLLLLHVLAGDAHGAVLQRDLHAAPLVAAGDQHAGAAQHIQKRQPLNADHDIGLLLKNPLEFGEFSVDQFGDQRGAALAEFEVVGVDFHHQFGVLALVGGDEAVDLQNRLARHDQFARLLAAEFHIHLGLRQAVAVGGDRPQHVVFQFHQHAVQVVADILHRHRERGFVQQGFQRQLVHFEALLPFVLLDAREVGRVQRIERVAAARRDDQHFVFVHGNGDRRAFRKHADDVQRLLHRHRERAVLALHFGD